MIHLFTFCYICRCDDQGTILINGVIFLCPGNLAKRTRHLGWNMTPARSIYFNFKLWTPLNESDWVYGFHLVRLFVRPSVCEELRVRSVPSTILAKSISYLHMLSANFRRCVACWVFFIQNFIFGNFSIFTPLALSCVHVNGMSKVHSSPELLL